MLNPIDATAVIASGATASKLPAAKASRARSPETAAPETAAPETAASETAAAHTTIVADAPTVRTALSRARKALLERQQPDGSWASDTDLGVIGVATQLLVEQLFAVLRSEDRELSLRYFERRQLADGSFEPFPHAGYGCVAVTATAWAALCACDHRGSAVAKRARRYVMDRGGFADVTRAFTDRGDLAALFLLSAGHLDADFLPKLPPGMALAPLASLLDRRVHAGNIMFMLVLAALGGRYGERPRGILSQARLALEQAKIRQHLFDWQNADGSWNGAPLQTVLMLLGLHAAGCTAGDPPVQRAFRWLEGMKRRTDELNQCAMDNDVWSTALGALAVHACEEARREEHVDACEPEGDSAESEALARAVGHLLRAQSREPMPRESQRKPGAVRVGGWAFQLGNDTMPDTDDTGVVLAALTTLAGDRSTRELFRSVDRGVDWLRDMQNPDGGFPTFVWGLPSKQPGPMFMEDLKMELDDPKAMLSAFVRPQAEYGDPSLAGVTGRVLWGLGKSGVGRNDAAVCRAIAFLKKQQCPNGAWWGRWKACYLAETATILLGLAAVGEDMHEDYVVRALRWVLSCQNEDGGFGELPDAYRDPQVAGMGPSMPPVTAYVMLGVLAARPECDADTDAPMKAAASYLLRVQRPDHLWDNGGWLHTFIPPRLMYVYDMPALALPPLALANFMRREAATPAGSW